MSPRKPLRGGQAMETTGFRLPKDLLREIDAFAADLSERTGIAVQRAEAVRYLITAGLRSERAGHGPARFKGGR